MIFIMNIYTCKLVVFVIVLISVLVVGETRRIIVSPRNTTVSQGDTVVLTCTVTNDITTDTMVLWMRGKFTISQDDVVNNRVDTLRYSVVGNESAASEQYNLQIENVKALDKGRYQCIIETREGSTIAESSVAWISYKHAPGLEYPRCDSENEVTYRAGEEVTFVCRSELAVPPVELTWSGENQEALDMQQKTEDSFRVATVTRQLSKEDNGKTFTCNLSHELVTDERNCDVGPLIVQYPPTDVEITSTRNGTLSVGDAVILTCLGEANPLVESSGITWWFVPSDIPDANIQLVSGQKLVLSNTQSAFNGVIVHCSLQNELGSSNATYIIDVSTPPPPPTTKPTTVSTLLDSILRKEYDFLVVFLIGIGFILVCFVLLIFVCRRRKGKTIVVMDSQSNLHTISLSETSVNRSKYLLSAPVVDRRNRTISENPSEDSAIHLISPTSGDETDFRGLIQRNQSNISIASNQTCGSGYHRVPSSEFLIDPSRNCAQPTSEPPRYVICDMVSQNGTPFPSVESTYRPYQSSTTGRPRFHQAETNGFETIPLRSVKSNGGSDYFVIQGGKYMPVQKIEDANLPNAANSQVQIIVGGSDNSSDGGSDIRQEGRSLLDPMHHPV